MTAEWKIEPWQQRIIDLIESGQPLTLVPPLPRRYPYERAAWELIRRVTQGDTTKIVYTNQRTAQAVFDRARAIIERLDGEGTTE